MKQFLFLVFALFTASAQADNEYYMSIGRSYATADMAQGLSASTAATRLSFGKNVHKNLDVEVLLLRGDATSDTASFNQTIDSYGTDPKVTIDEAYRPTLKLTLSGKLNSGAGVFIKPKVELIEDFTVFAKLGVINLNATLGTDGVTCISNCAMVPVLKARYPEYFTQQSRNLSVTGTSYGMGTAIRISSNVELLVDYMRLPSVDGYKMSATSISLKYDF